MIVKSYNKKLIISGDIYEFYNYLEDVYYNHTVKVDPVGRSVEADNKQKIKNREKVLSRARRDLRRLINANVGRYGDCTAKFFTFTFAKNVQDLQVANNEWKKFIKRLNYRYKINSKYVVVVEFQKRGAIHYHAVFFNLPYIPVDDLAKVWRNGFVWVNKIDDVDNVGAYICKYITKDSIDDRLQGKKCYFSSRGLYKPVELRDEKKIGEILARLSPINIVYNVVFENEYNTIHYIQYNTKKLHSK